MIALDTNILARFYVVDQADPEAAKQRTIAHRLLTESPQVFVPLTVILTMAWRVDLSGLARKNFAEMDPPAVRRILNFRK
jgi:predicted nucleic-acid-binding protein